MIKQLTLILSFTLLYSNNIFAYNVNNECEKQLNKGKFEEALKAANSVKDKYDSNFCKGKANFRLRNNDQAIKDFEIAEKEASIQADQMQAILFKGITQRDSGDFKGSNKTFIYGFLYGAGNAKIGSIIGKGSREGGKIKTKFLDSLPALSRLINGVQKAAERGYLKGLDGRHIHVRAKFAALNTLLQGAGALVCKQWAVEFDEAIKAKGWSSRVQTVANVHDEFQIEVDEDIAEEVATICIDAIKTAGKHFNLRVPLDGDANIGTNWKETH